WPGRHWTVAAGTDAARVPPGRSPGAVRESAGQRHSRSGAVRAGPVVGEAHDDQGFSQPAMADALAAGPGHHVRGQRSPEPRWRAGRWRRLDGSLLAARQWTDGRYRTSWPGWGSWGMGSR